MTDPEAMTPLTDAFLDRIVEGNLSPAELRAALARFERDPDGWRRCALAFLEAQCWRESFRTSDPRSSANGGGFAVPAPAPTRSRPDRARWRRLSAAAGIAAVSFALGWRSRPMPTVLSRPSAPPAIVNVDPSANRALPEAIATSPPIADWKPQDTAMSDVASPIEGLRPVRVVRAVGFPAMPVMTRSGIAEQLVKDQSPPITEHQQAILAQRGYQVDRRRRLVTATLADGRRVTMPIEQIRLRYQGNEPL